MKRWRGCGALGACGSEKWIYRARHCLPYSVCPRFNRSSPVQGREVATLILGRRRRGGTDHRGPFQRRLLLLIMWRGDPRQAIEISGNLRGRYGHRRRDGRWRSVVAYAGRVGHSRRNGEEARGTGSTTWMLVIGLNRL